jgi:hypothetical protein
MNLVVVALPKKHVVGGDYLVFEVQQRRRQIFWAKIFRSFCHNIIITYHMSSLLSVRLCERRLSAPNLPVRQPPWSNKLLLLQ